MSSKFKFFLILAPLWIFPFLGFTFLEQNKQFFCLPDENPYVQTAQLIQGLGGLIAIPAFLITAVVLLLRPSRSYAIRLLFAALAFVFGLLSYPLITRGVDFISAANGGTTATRCPKPDVDHTSPTQQTQNAPDGNNTTERPDEGKYTDGSSRTPEGNTELNLLFSMFLFLPGAIPVAILTFLFYPRPLTSEGIDEAEFLSTSDVLTREFQLLSGQRQTLPDLNAYCRAAHQFPMSALCLSGGGIRSASFCLGVIQALAAKRLLTQFDYLSTVSGGGYIGAWLTRWIYEENHDADTVQEKLSGEENAPTPDLVQIHALRENSNYLDSKGRSALY